MLYCSRLCSHYCGLKFQGGNEGLRDAKNYLPLAKIQAQQSNWLHNEDLQHSNLDIYAGQCTDYVCIPFGAMPSSSPAAKLWTTQPCDSKDTAPTTYISHCLEHPKWASNPGYKQLLQLECMGQISYILSYEQSNRLPSRQHPSP